MKLGEYIQSVFDEKGINMTKAAKLAGVSLSSLSRLKSGESELTPNLAAKLSVAGFDYELMFELEKKEKIIKTKSLINDSL